MDARAAAITQYALSANQLIILIQELVFLAVRWPTAFPAHLELSAQAVSITIIISPLVHAYCAAQQCRTAALVLPVPSAPLVSITSISCRTINACHAVPPSPIVKHAQVEVFARYARLLPIKTMDNALTAPTRCQDVKPAPMPQVAPSASPISYFPMLHVIHAPFLFLTATLAFLIRLVLLAKQVFIL